MKCTVLQVLQVVGPERAAAGNGLQQAVAEAQGPKEEKFDSRCSQQNATTVIEGPQACAL